MEPDKEYISKQIALSDPSILTTQQLWREIASLKELVSQEIEGVKEAVKVAHDDLVRVPTEVQRAVAALEKLHEEKFKCVDVWQNTRVISIDKRFDDLSTLTFEKFSGVEKQFKERDIRTDQSAVQTKVAVDAALQAAKEAFNKQNETFTISINKSEAATNKIIDQQAVLIVSMTKAFDDKIDDMKERMTRMEQLAAAQIGASTGRKDLWGYAVGAIMLLIAVITFMSKFK